MLVFIVLLMAALFAVNVNGQASYNSSYSISESAYMPLAASTASNVAAVIDCRLQSKITLQVDFQSNTNEAVTVAFPIQRSGNGTTYTPTRELITLTCLGATSGALNCDCTNIDTYGCGWIKIPWVTNAHATANITNLVLRPILKRNAP